jgi:hypothetical protein
VLDVEAVYFETVKIKAAGLLNLIEYNSDMLFSGAVCNIVPDVDKVP